jgi:hypothetical protein
MADKGKRHSQVSCTKTGVVGSPRAALRELVSAWECAHDVKSDPWEFAVEAEDLAALGLGKSTLRWLVKKGYALHAREVTRPGDAARRFQPELSLAFASKTCFILTHAGHSWQALEELAPAALRPHEDPAGTPVVAAPVPRWDRRTRTLYLGDQIVKRYRVPAENQEAVLSAFEEEGWGQVIDDPLPPVPDVCPDVRLRDTIRRLNASQTSHLLRFYGDGTGEHVLWEMRVPNAAARKSVRRAA